MNMPKILEDFIARYFNKKMMPGIIKEYLRLQKKYEGAQNAGNAAAADANEPGAGNVPAVGKDFYLASFGYQTLFMMRYMAMAFAAICVILVIIGLSANPMAFMGLKIFVAFLAFCIILWALSLLQSGFIVYTKDWIYVQRPGKKADYAFSDLRAMKVKGKLTLRFDADVKIPLEGTLYMEFIAFMEKNHPQIVAAILPAEYDKARRKHASAWGNRL